MNEILKQIQVWFSNQCDGDWEHQFQIIIQTIDNPGWSIEIHLRHTSWENINLPVVQEEKNDQDWYFYKIEDRVFRAAGDPLKLEFLLSQFLNVVEVK